MLLLVPDVASPELTEFLLANCVAGVGSTRRSAAQT